MCGFVECEKGAFGLSIDGVAVVKAAVSARLYLAVLLVVARP